MTGAIVLRMVTTYGGQSKDLSATVLNVGQTFTGFDSPYGLPALPGILVFGARAIPGCQAISRAVAPAYHSSSMAGPASG